ncbi:hypothetical protein EW146_g4165 [Bondarzewia mesenterica]|uniref:HSF-type DNA-binding domain-containing protein n=1 Tax=Bondarzewia mesenterica TaxID=1095465 RepID=A0A4S4LX74_9AGAM|nr:hypothetical protein EW146_g4165 [Bondarzewia mesenterica]
MASDNQLALRTFKAGVHSLNKAARQSVPQFLQKLYEIVNDPNNNDMIRWTDSGDSFVVLDHERLSREVLGRWFKHQKFQSFVRQLNMYGFHKIPHLQQGVLKSDSDTEIWNFEHPHFHRGQPDLLCLIQRKKQVPQNTATEDALLEAARESVAHASSSQPTHAQLLDINSIVSGIAAVKRHQQAISADLNELKNSNQLLWQEALAARERHKNHQDTINRILKFLASVFGRSNGHDSKNHDDHGSPQPMVSRKRQRLMIGDALDAKQKGVEVVEDEDEKSMSQADQRSRSTSQFARIETPSTASPSIHSESYSPVIPLSNPYYANPLPSRITQQPWNAAPTPSLTSTDANNQMHGNTALEAVISQSQPSSSSVPISTNQQLTTTVAPQNSTDATLQTAFQQLIHSPDQLQRFMQALSNASSLQSQSLPVPPYTSFPHPQLSQITPYGPPLDFSSFTSDPNAANAHALLPKAEDGPPLEPLLNGSDHLQKSYKDASEIDADVDALQASINSLIENMGLDPALLAAQQQQQPGEGSRPATPALDIAPDLDFDAFLSLFAQQNAEQPNEHLDNTAQLDSITGGTRNTNASEHGNGPGVGIDDAPLEQLHAFMDEVASTSDTSSPILRTVEMPHSNAAAIGAARRKRPSDVAELAQDLPLMASEPSLKRSKK